MMGSGMDGKECPEKTDSSSVSSRGSDIRASCRNASCWRAAAQKRAADPIIVPGQRTMDRKVGLTKSGFLCFAPISVMLLATFATMSTIAGQDNSGTIAAQGCFLRLKEHAQVPARDQGVLLKFHCEPGDSVREGDLLASLDDTQSRLSMQLAEIDLAIAEKRLSESTTVEIAKTAVEESATLLEQARVDLEVSRKMAESDIAIRLGQAANAYSQEALDRALKSRQDFSTSVSELELAKLRMERDRNRLDVEQAEYDQSLQSLRSAGRAAFVQQQQIAARRLALELNDAETEHAVAQLTTQRMSKTLELAEEHLARRQIKTPVSGIVVEQLQQQGEWVEAGQPVLRIIRLDRLLVEGYVEAQLVDQSSRGRKVQVQAQTRKGSVVIEGQLTFVSPEIDSVNQQVLVKAEIENRDLQLRPGQPVEMVIAAP